MEAFAEHAFTLRGSLEWLEKPADKVLGRVEPIENTCEMHHKL